MLGRTSDAAAPAIPATTRRRWMRPLATKRVAQYSGVLLLGAALLALARCFAQLRGSDTDLFPRWHGLRVLLLDGRDPYQPSVTAEIVAQTAFGTAPEAVRAAYGFVYPLPGALLLSPLVALPYEWAATAWLAIGLVALPLAALAAAGTLGRRPGRVATRLIIPLALLFVPSWWSLALVQPGLAVVGLVGSAVWTAARRPTVAGIALASAALLKPQTAAPLAIAWAAYAAGRWRRAEARSFLEGAAVGDALLTAIATVALPFWPAGFVTALRSYGEVPELRSLTPALLVAAATLPGAASNPALATALSLAGKGAIGALALWTLLGWARDARSGVTLPVRGITRTLVATALAVPPAWETNGLVLLVPLAGALGGLRGRAALGFSATWVALSLVLAPLPLVLPWRSGAVTALGYSLLWAAGEWLNSRSARAAGAGAPADRETPGSL